MMGRRRIQRTRREQIKFMNAQKNRKTRNQMKRRNQRNLSKSDKIIKPTLFSQTMTAKYGKNQWKQLKDKNIEEHYIGLMDIQCIYCHAKHFKSEKVSNKGNSFNDCCSHGTVPLTSFTTFPRKLCSLFSRKHEFSKEFLENIRMYNTSLSFASFNANLMNFKNNRPGPYCFKIKGRIYYQINTSLYPENDRNASFGQLFILDPSEANEQRMDTFSGLNEPLLILLENIIRKKNVFARSYQMMKNEIIRLEERAKQKGEPIPEVRMAFMPRRGIDARRYNTQQCNEIAAVFTTTCNGEIPDTYVTIRNISTNKLEYISSMDPKVEPWIYPLFYPRGDLGWERDLKRSMSDSRITRSAYIKNLIAIRDEFNPFLNGGRLFQQWIVDNYVKVEKDRTEYCKSHQGKLRSETYQGVMDYLHNREKEGFKIGKPIILPSTFIGSPRNMAQNYQDAMAIVRKYGKPDLFITMTCNPNWREIRENLLPGQHASDRPDIVARVFNLKVKALLKLITKKAIFGKVQAYVYVIEFQKRGLPHIHLLITLMKNYKITRPEIVDRFISAEIPDPEKDQYLHNIVWQHMIHGPCADWCLVNGKCSKHFPKPFQSKTVMDKDGYPIYRRRNTEKYYVRNKTYVFDNRFVVPYSPYLLRKFNCHCNVEVVSSIKSVKYLFKYIYKGHDAASFSLDGVAANTNEFIYDEIKEHIEARFVGPVEATWRILSKKLHDKSHSIIRMPVHLPNHHNLIIDPDVEELSMQHILDQKNMLIDYFLLNQRDLEAKKHLYVDIPNFYTFHKEKINDQYTSLWRKRRTCFKCIGRMYSVSPSQVELFHLRLLLLTIKGATSFIDLRTVDGHIHSTFTEACVALGLVADDYEWSRAMHEAEVWMMPYNLRRLFVRILLNCFPLHPEDLWEEFKFAMSEDFSKNMPLVEAQKKSLQQINIFLEEEGRNLRDFPTLPIISENEIVTQDEIYFRNLLEKGFEYYRKLNEDQQRIINTILHSVENYTNNVQKCFYLDGPGGSGKTFLYTCLWYLLMGNQIRVQTMAFTGIAATLLPQGKTVHKTFGLTVPLYSDSNSTIKSGSKEAKLLCETMVFIWDEAPMAPRYALEAIDRNLRDIMNNENLFGGKIIILGGDFRQLLPVNIHGTRNETIDLSIKYSHLWQSFQKFSLTKNMRTLSDEIEFSKLLLEIGNGYLNDEEDNLQLPESWIETGDVNIAEDIYGDLLKAKKFKEASRCAILAARNIDVDAINDEVVKLLDVTSERIYTSVDSTENCNGDDEINSDLVPEYLNSLNPSGLPPHELKLRRFSIVILIRNLNISEGLCNGTRLLVLDLNNNLLRCEILTGDKSGEIVFLHRITLICENVYPFTFSRRQFPIKLAFAITINKSQGQTFERIGIDLRRDVFNHGQLYVALSRVRSWKFLRIYIGSQRQTTKVKNYVYGELLCKDE